MKINIKFPAGILTVIFITLKLFNAITWSWWWVISPLWIPVALMIFATIGIVLLALVETALGE